MYSTLYRLGTNLQGEHSYKRADHTEEEEEEISRRLSA